MGGYRVGVAPQSACTAEHRRIQRPGEAELTPIEFIAVTVAGGLGACLRLLVDDEVQRRAPTEFPSGVLLINLSGSLALGFVTGAAAASVGSDAQVVVIVVGIGFLGGFTTFGTASVATARLLAKRRVAAALVAGPGMLIGGIACAALGWAMAAGLR